MSLIRSTIFLVSFLSATLIVSRPVAATVLAGEPALVGWWPGEGNANNLAGGNTGTLVGPVAFSQGVVGQAFDLNGNAFVSVGNPAELRITGDLTLLAWIFPRQDHQPVHLVTRRAPGCGVMNYQMTLDCASSPGTQSGCPEPLQLSFSTGFNQLPQFSGLEAPVNQWALVAVVFHAATATVDFYVNNQQTLGIPTQSLGDAPTADVEIGLANGCGGAFNGLIDEVRIYNRSLTAQEISAMRATAARRPVIIIPGILGSELKEGTTNETVWPPSVTDLLNANGAWPLKLLLNKDGITPSGGNLCVDNLAKSCMSAYDCFFDLTIPCAPAGRELYPSGITDFDLPTSFLDRFEFHAYSRLIAFLETIGGYRFGQDLFIFPYDWRLDIGTTGQALRNLIEGIQQLTSTNEVDIIAHSQGGLLTRAYLQQHPGDERVETVIYLGTPHFGAPLAFANLRGFRDLPAWYKLLFPNVSNTATFIAQNLPAVYELLPRYSFVTTSTGLQLIQQSFQSLSNPGLVALASNFHQNLGNTNPIARSFQINGAGQLTMRIIDMTDPRGCVLVLPDLKGDGTVPRVGSEGFSGTTYFFVEGEHHVLPEINAVQKKILNLLQGNDMAPVTGILDQPTAAPIPTQLYSSCSPIKIKIIDTFGNVTGKDAGAGVIREDVPGSAHFTFEHNEAGYFPRQGDYTVEVTATEAGLFGLSLDTIEPDESVSAIIDFRDIPISAVGRGELTVTSGAPPVLTLDLDSDGVSDVEIEANEMVPSATLIVATKVILRTLGLPRGVEFALSQKLHAAGDAIERGKLKTARLILGAFKIEVSVLGRKRIPTKVAAVLIALADQLLESLREV